MKVIYVMADSMRRDHVGAYGTPPWGPVYTPNLDRFASSAAVFDNAYIGSFPTVPNRRDTLLGRGDKGLPFNRWRGLDTDEVTFPAMLGDRSIPSMLITDTQNNVTGDRNLQRDYSAWALNRGQEGDRYWLDDTVPIINPVPKHLIRYPQTMWHQVLVNRAQRRTETDWFAPGTYSMAMEWLERNYTREHFFLWIDTFDPHEPWDPPQHYIDRYDPGYTGRVFDAPSYGLRKKMGITNRELTHIRARYAGEVTMVDTWFGHLMAKLEVLGIADEVVVIFAADHGTCFDGPGDIGHIHKLPWVGADGLSIAGGRKPRPPMRYTPLSQNVARIPLMVRLPGMSRQKRIRPIVQPWDVTATILDLYGIAAPEHIIGHSLLPLINSDKRRIGSRRSAVLGHSSGGKGDGGFVQAMDGTWSFTVWRGERGPALHHMVDDPNCRRNLVKTRPGVARRLWREISEFMAGQELPDEWVEGYTLE